MTVTIIVAVASNGVIGKDGWMPFNLPADLANFKRVTMGHVLVMGRRTYDSIGKSLPGRTTVVVTRNPDWACDKALTAPGFGEALELAAGIDDEVFIAGGREMYAAGLAVADRMIYTHIDAEPEGDTWFPDVDWSQWSLESEDLYDGFAIRTYVRPHQPSPRSERKFHSRPRARGNG